MQWNAAPVFEEDGVAARSKKSNVPQRMFGKELFVTQLELIHTANMKRKGPGTRMGCGSHIIIASNPLFDVDVCLKFES